MCYYLCSLGEADETRNVGRPREEVDLDQVEFLCSLNLTLVKIAAILGVSRYTIYRRLHEEGRFYDRYTDISDQDLDRTIAMLKVEHPQDGEVMMIGHLYRQQIRIPRARLRASIHTVDHEGTESRRLRAIRRRIYHVDHSNTVWHLDGNHKLIRWRFVIHGAVDGYSRKLVFLKCATNNRAATVVEQFSKAVTENGLPDRVRTDNGGENVDVWRYMIFYHHYDPSCVFTGSSTHNERIERMWRDVTRCVGAIFREKFFELEEHGLLDPLNEIDLFCVHYVFLPMLNQCLQQFAESWNFHPLSTEHNLSPEQLFAIGLIDRCNSDVEPTSLPPAWRNVSNSALPVDDPELVDVPETPSNVCMRLQAELDNLAVRIPRAGDVGISLYNQVVQSVGRHLQQNVCNECFQ